MTLIQMQNELDLISFERAVELGIKYSMTDEQVIELLKGAKVPKAQMDLFIPWFRAAEKRSIARDNSR